MKHRIATTSSNSTSSGSAGLNMNEGTVKLSGATTDTLANSAGLRLGNLQIGDGVSAKIVVWVPTKQSTLYIRSLTVKSTSTFWIGAANDSIANDIGNGSSSGIPTLSGGITIESGAGLLVQDFPGGTNAANLNLDGGGIVNNGMIDLRAGAQNTPGSYYHLHMGGLSAGASSTNQTISGSSVGQFADITVGTDDTLKLLQDINISSIYKVTLHGTLLETAGNTVTGTIEAKRTMTQSVQEDFGGIGITLKADSAAPGLTTVTRVTGIAQTGGSHSSILRYFDVSPATNSGLGASMDFYYDDSELAGQTASALQLWKSADLGTTWVPQTTTNDAGNHKLSANSINAFTRWTAADPAHELGSTSAKYVVQGNWNMMSLPLTVTDYRKTAIYPTATSNAFAFMGGYVRKDTLQNGLGYWLKFAAEETVSINGTLRTHDIIPVNEGWNMIGSIGSPVAKTAIGEIPPGIISSQLYGYNGSYTASDSILPGKGYWIKTNGNGTLHLSTSGPANYPKVRQPESDGLNTLKILDVNGHAQTLRFGTEMNGRFKPSYDEVPPLPPAGSFDARFASNRMVETYTSSTIMKHYPILVQADEGAVTVSWNILPNKKESFMLTDDAGRKQSMTGNGSMTMGVADARKLMLDISADGALPKEFSLGANYPNPFNPSTRFTISIPNEAHVDVIVYDLLGRKIATLVNEVKAAGYHTIEWNGETDNRTKASSGIYVVRMISGTFNAVQKVMMMK